MADEKTYYAWAPIAHKNEDGSDASLKPGDKVPSELVDSEAGEVWIEDGTIRRRKYPENVPPGLSVRTHLLREANRAFEEAQRVGSPDAIEPQTENPSAVTPNSESPTAGTGTAPAQEQQQPSEPQQQASS